MFIKKVVLMFTAPMVFTCAVAAQDQMPSTLLVTGMTGKICVAAFEPMHHADGQQRVESPIDRDRCQPLAASGQAVQHLVGADGAM